MCQEQANEQIQLYNRSEEAHAYRDWQSCVIERVAAASLLRSAHALDARGPSRGAMHAQLRGMRITIKPL